MLLEVRNVTKKYARGDKEVQALRGVSTQIERGQFISVMGPSGSGKSSFLQIIGGLDRPTSGSVLFNSEKIEDLADAELSRFRRRKLGFIFQFFNLLPSLSALENVALPLLLDGETMKKIRPKAEDLLRKMNLGDRMHHRPSQLSGGEMQRVAIARALVADPLLLLADEPTGNLDSKTGASVLELLRSLARDHNQAIIMVTHDRNAANYGHRLITLRDGMIESEIAVSGGKEASSHKSEVTV